MTILYHNHWHFDLHADGCICIFVKCISVHSSLIMINVCISRICNTYLLLSKECLLLQECWLLTKGEISLTSSYLDAWECGFCIRWPLQKVDMLHLIVKIQIKYLASAVFYILWVIIKQCNAVWIFKRGHILSVLYPTLWAVKPSSQSLPNKNDSPSPTPRSVQQMLPCFQMLRLPHVPGRFWRQR